MSAPVVLVLRALGLGDLLTVVPALRGLRRAFPDHRIVLAGPEGLAPLARHTGLVDAVVPARGLHRLPPAVDRPAVAVNLHGRGPVSHRVLVATQPSRMIAFAHDEVPGVGGRVPWRAGEHEVVRWCRLLAEEGIACDPTELRIPPFPARVPAGWQAATIIHPGASSPTRCWPVSRWAEVARHERAAGRTVLVTGGPGERRLTAGVVRAAGLHPAADLGGHTDVASLGALVGSAERVLSTDTGVAHLATALGTPSVVLFASMSPAEWGPLIDPDRHRVLWRGAPSAAGAAAGVGGAGGEPSSGGARPAPPSWTAMVVEGRASAVVSGRPQPDPVLLRIEVPDVLAALATLPAPSGLRSLPAA